MIDGSCNEPYNKTKPETTVDRCERDHYRDPVENIGKALFFVGYTVGV
jgi:hypothetical protein